MCWACLDCFKKRKKERFKYKFVHNIFMHAVRIGRAQPSQPNQFSLASKTHGILVENIHPTIKEGERAKLFYPFSLELTAVRGFDSQTGYMYAGYAVHGAAQDERDAAIREITVAMWRQAGRTGGRILDHDYQKLESLERSVDLGSVSGDYSSLFRVPPATLEHIDLAARLDALYAAAEIARKGEHVLSIPKAERLFEVGEFFVRLRFPDGVILDGGVLVNQSGPSMKACERCSGSVNKPAFPYSHRVILIQHSEGKWLKLPITPLDVHEYIYHSASTFERVGEPLPANEDAGCNRRLFGVQGSLM